LQIDAGAAAARPHSDAVDDALTGVTDLPLRACMAAAPTVGGVTLQIHAVIPTRGIPAVAKLHAPPGVAGTVTVDCIFTSGTAAPAVIRVGLQIHAVLITAFEGNVAVDLTLPVLARGGAIQRTGTGRTAGAAMLNVTRRIDTGPATIQPVGTAGTTASSGGANLPRRTRFAAPTAIGGIAVRVNAATATINERRRALGATFAVLAGDACSGQRNTSFATGATILWIRIEGDAGLAAHGLAFAARLRRRP